jgi:hypothetical protein
VVVAVVVVVVVVVFDAAGSTPSHDAQQHRHKGHGCGTHQS